jgi:hypothetical protein
VLILVFHPQKSNILETQFSNEKIYQMALEFPPSFMIENSYFLEDSFHYLLFDTLLLRASGDFEHFNSVVNFSLRRINQESILIYKPTWLEEYYTQPMKELKDLYSATTPGSSPLSKLHKEN